MLTRIIIYILIASSNIAFSIDKKIAEFGNWTMYISTVKGKRICHLKNHQLLDKNSLYLDIYIKQYANNIFLELKSNFLYKQNTPKIIFNNYRFNLFTKGKQAWLYSKAYDAKMVGLMKKKSTMKVSLSDNKNNHHNIDINLANFNKAFKYLNSNCK